MEVTERNLCNADERRRCSLFQFATGRLPGCCAHGMKTTGPDTREKENEHVNPSTGLRGPSSGNEAPS